MMSQGVCMSPILSTRTKETNKTLCGLCFSMFFTFYSMCLLMMVVFWPGSTITVHRFKTISGLQCYNLRGHIFHHSVGDQSF